MKVSNRTSSQAICSQVFAVVVFHFLNGFLLDGLNKLQKRSERNHETWKSHEILFSPSMLGKVMKCGKSDRSHKEIHEN